MESNLPTVAQRIRAVVYDSFILIVLMAVSTFIFDQSEDIDTIRIATFVFIFLLHDPITTSFLGGTAGHHLCGIRVARIKNQHKKINIVVALIRFIIKWLLCWVSLLTVQSSKNRQAIHDHVVNSIVAYK